jgi:hypothetical protein
MPKRTDRRPTVIAESAANPRAAGRGPSPESRLLSNGGRKRMTSANDRADTDTKPRDRGKANSRQETTRGRRHHR